MAEHLHCPLGCEHPQPIEIDGVSYCAMCLMRSIRTVCEPCSPELCDDHQEDDHG